ncbi:MAG TPA: carboxyltransferase domain-containing protein, partial [Thermoanaerobaculia bacterium]|nr:carboxyltransferase domain-containing protein [Thermoanaerobaculia bacterium]
MLGRDVQRNFRDVADGALLAEFPEAAQAEANRQAVAIARHFGRKHSAGFFDAVAGARAVLLFFEPRRLSRGRLVESVRRVRAEAPAVESSRRALRLP